MKTVEIQEIKEEGVSGRRKGSRNVGEERSMDERTEGSCDRVCLSLSLEIWDQMDVSVVIRHQGGRNGTVWRRRRGEGKDKIKRVRE